LPIRSTKRINKEASKLENLYKLATFLRLNLRLLIQ